MKTSSRKLLANIYTILIFIFMYAPIAVLIAYSFNKSQFSAKWSGFTLNWYAELFQDRQIMIAFYYTVLVALLSSTIAVIIGTLAAIKLNYMRGVKREVLLGINNLPILNPDIVTGISLMTLFVFLRFERGFTTMLIAHITFNIPFVVLSVMPKLKQLSKDRLEAAVDLGATYFYAFRKVLIPEILPGIITGWLISFTMSIDDFVISFFTTGNGVYNLSIKIYSMTKRGFTPKINAISTIMFLFVLVLLLIVNKIQKKGDVDVL